MIQRLSTVEIQAKLPAWEWLAALFIDNKLSESEYKNIAFHLSQTNYSISSLEAMMTNEIGPIFINNINGKAPFPETVVFTRNDVLEIMERHYDRLNGINRFLLTAFQADPLKKNKTLKQRWSIVKNELHKLGVPS
ncbi:MAG: hypothetical protein Q4G54_00610 [Pelistega sp.]|nr:hypothetical protein [Pelistega sp.]